MDLPLRGLQTFGLSVVVLRDYEMTGRVMLVDGMAGLNCTSFDKAKLLFPALRVHWPI
jgi:hypothetical protein